MTTPFVLGTVQFGRGYGRRAGEPPLDDAVVDRILGAAWELGVRAFDTATAYGAAGPRLADWLRRTGHLPDAAVVTKIPPESEPLGRAVRDAVDPFRGAASCTVLAHASVSTARWSVFHDAVRAAGGRAGVSVYEAGEVRFASGLDGMARVQAPANALDWSVLTARGDAPVPVDIRSVWLQGVLLDPPDVAEQRAPGAGPAVRAVAQAAFAVGESAPVILLASAVHRLRAGDRVVVGLDAAEQVDPLRRALAVPGDTVEAFTRALASAVPAGIDRAVLDPRQWPVRR